MFALRLAFKNIISRKSSLVIVLFIAFSIAVLVMANAVFDGTGTGIEKTFSSNFTGDIVIRPKADFPMSLFGDETPVTGSLSELPQIVPYTQIYGYVSSVPGIKAAVPQITGQAVLRFGDDNVPVYMFGVDGKRYGSLMEGIRILEGEPYGPDENKIMLSTQVLKIIRNATDRDVKVGDTVQLISSNGSSYTLRAAEVSAIYEYSVENDIQDKIVLVNPSVLRSLIGMVSTSIDESLFDESNSGLLDGFDSIDDLFGDASIEDSMLSDSADQSIEAKKESLQSVPEPSGQVEKNNSDETVWNYIVCDVEDGVPAKLLVRRLNRYFVRNELAVQAVDWRTAAGMAAQYIYWMRLIFNIGIIIIIGTGFIVVNNTLVIAALDRTKETGVLRAIGAGRRFVGIEYLFETLMLTLSAGLIGCLLGIFGNSLMVSSGIEFSNTYLIQLFGGRQLKTVITAVNLMKGMGLSLILAIIGWLYPVRIALSTSPVMAMEAVR